MKKLLEINKLNVNFNINKSLLHSLIPSERIKISAVSDVSFEVRESEIYGIIGESGCGKTTLAKTIAGLNKADSGSILFDNNELFGLSSKQLLPYRKDISMIFQDPIGSLSPRKTIGYSVSEPFRIQGMKTKDLEQESIRLLKMVGLNKDFVHRYPHQLSGGQARRVGVARALCLDPRLIIADEPTAGLDVSIQGGLLNLLRKIQDDSGLSVIIITHNLNIARHITDRIAIMYLGEFLEEGPTTEIFSKTQHPYTSALLSANPVIDFDNPAPKITLAGEPPSLLSTPQGCKFHKRCPAVRADCNQTVPQWQHTGKSSTHFHRCLYPGDFAPG